MLTSLPLFLAKGSNKSVNREIRSRVLPERICACALCINAGQSSRASPNVKVPKSSSLSSMLPSSVEASHDTMSGLPIVYHKRIRQPSRLKPESEGWSLKKLGAEKIT